MKFFEKKRGRCFAGFIKLPTFAIAKRKQALPSEAESPKENGRLAQLVQSVCLTSRGSAVRIRQRPQKHDGSLAQLNRAFDYGSKGYRFESYRSHIHSYLCQAHGSLAQLNRASDYGSEGYRFESYRSHKEEHEGQWLPSRCPSLFFHANVSPHLIGNTYFCILCRLSMCTSRR